MDRTTSTSWPRDLITAAATGVVTAAVPVHRWGPGLRWGTHAGLGVAAAGATAWFVSRAGAGGAGTPPAGTAATAADSREDAPEAPGARATAAVAVLSGLLVAGASIGGTALDQAAERALARRGVARPRWWLGAAAAVVSLGSSAVERRTPRATG